MTSSRSLLKTRVSLLHLLTTTIQCATCILPATDSNAIPYSVMEKRLSSSLSDQPSQPKPDATPSPTKYIPPHKRARHKKPHIPLHQGTPTLSAQCSSSTKKQHPKPHRTTSHTRRLVSVAQCEVEQKTLLGMSLQSNADATLPPVDGAAASPSSSFPPATLGRFAIPSLPPVMSFGGNRSLGVAGLPFTAFQLKAVSVMFAARMAARLQQGDVTPCSSVSLDVDDSVRDSNDSGGQGCVEYASGTCSRGGTLKVIGETCVVQEVKRGKGGLDVTQETMKKQGLGATGSSDTAFGSIPREIGQEERVDGRGARPKKQRPDAFVAIRISSPQIRSSLERIQSSITSIESRLGPAMVSLDKLHLTLMVLKLGEEEERIARAKEALSQSCTKIATYFNGHGRHSAPPLTVPFKGVGAFSSSVVFACVDPSETEVLQHLMSITDIVRSSFLEAGLEATDLRPFAPHLTVAKMSKLQSRKHSRHVRLSKDLYRGFTEEPHGSHLVSELELLSMSRPTTEDGYYHCFTRCSWVSVANGSPPLPPPMDGKEEASNYRALVLPSRPEY